MKLGAALVIVTSVLINGCTTMSSDDCKKANWQLIGWQDGQKGLEYRRLDSYVKDCSAKGYSIDRTAWQRGYKLGLKLYCSPNNGYRIGETGKPYYGVCSNSEFAEQYKAGRKEYLRQNKPKDVNFDMP